MTSPALQAPDLAAIREAAGRIGPHAHRTPALACRALDRMAGRRLILKCESFQKVGAFKFRGACNAVLCLTPEAAARGVVTHSSGNHAQALALAAAIRGIRAHIVMPSNAIAVKRRAVEAYGGLVHECAPTLDDREAIAERVIAETGATFVPPYAHPDIIAGQGTATLELLEQAEGPLDALIAPIGGGGLMAGTCLAARGLDPGIRLFGAEPEGADDASRSLAAGTFIPQTDPRTIADGLRTSLGEHTTWPIIRDHVERIFTVSEGEIVSAMRLVWERMKIVIEPSAAVPIAAVLGGPFRALEGIERVGVIVSGGNVEFKI